MVKIRGNRIYVSELDEFRCEITKLLVNKVVLTHGIEAPVDIMKLLNAFTEELFYHHDIDLSYWNHEDDPDCSIGKWNMQFWQMKDENPKFTLNIRLDEPDENNNDYVIYNLYLKPKSDD